MRLRWLLCVTWSLLIASAAHGQTPAAPVSERADRSVRAQSVDWLTPLPKAGARLRVDDRSGRAITGEFVAVRPSAIRLTSDGVIREVPLSEIATVRRHGDSLWNGVAWGAGVAAITVVNYNGDCDTCYGAAELAAYRLAMVGVGAGIGAVLDFMVRDKRILYRASTAGDPGALVIQPTVSRRAHGVVLSLHW